MSTVNETIVPELLRSVVHAPEVAHPLYLAAGVAAVAAYTVFDYYRYDPEKRLGSAHDPSNPGLVRQAVIDMETGEDKSRRLFDRWYRMGAPLLLGISALSLGTAASADFTYSAPRVVAQANTIIDLETATSFLSTFDMPGHQSRFTAAVGAIEHSSYKGNLAIMQFGQNFDLSTPLEPFSVRNVTTSVTPNVVTTNGANIVQAMMQSAQLLPDHKGTEIVITDGLVEDSARSIEQQVEAQQKEGITTEIIEIGTNGSYYVDNLGASPSPATPTKIFSDLNPANVEVTTNPKAVTTAIESAVAAADTTPGKQPYYPAYLPGIVTGLWGILRTRRQHRKKLI